ncbi:MAG: hypothetical protein HY279_14100 [Nitrospinae bacterium]|nr:hypothetical protein [Nitrospinota bacterium]
MPEKKICPILPPDHNKKPQECLADRCGWWDGMEGRCAIAVISFFLRMGIRVKK